MHNAICSASSRDGQLPLFPELVDASPCRALVVRRPMLRDLWAEVAADHGLAPFQMAEITSRQEIAAARQEFFYRARRECLINYRPPSYPYLGQFVARMRRSGREMDHSTVIHGERRHAQRLREGTIRRIREDVAANVAAHGGLQ